MKRVEKAGNSRQQVFKNSHLIIVSLSFGYVLVEKPKLQKRKKKKREKLV